MMWFRVELDRSGAILKCDQVELASKQSSLVRYIEADSKTDACSQVKAWAANHRKNRCESQKNLRARAREAGVCQQCRKRPAKPKCVTCQECIDQQTVRVQLRRQGLGPGSRQLPDDQLRANVRIQRARRGVGRFRRVLREFDARGPDGFRAWLVEEIEKRSK